MMSYKSSTLSRNMLSLGHSKDDDSLAAQTRTTINWVNYSLKSKSLKITNLDSDLESGVILIKLLECLAPVKKMPGRYNHARAS